MDVKIIGGGPHHGHVVQAARGVTKLLLPDCPLDQASSGCHMYAVRIERDSSGKLVADWRKKALE